MIGRRARFNASSAGLRSPRSGPGTTRLATSGGSATYSPASRVVSLCGNSKCTGPGGAPVAVRMARRTCWRTVLASTVVLHLTIGSYNASWLMRWRRPIS